MQKEHGKGAIIELFLEDDMTKLDSRWLANVLGYAVAHRVLDKRFLREIVA